MSLIDATLEERFAEIGKQENSENPIVLAKFFDFTSVFRWYATEYDPEQNICFGYVHNMRDPIFSEWGYFSIAELEALCLGNTNVKMVERDALFSEQPIHEIIKKVDKKIEQSYGIKQPEKSVEQER